MTLSLCVLLWATEGNENGLAEYEDTVLALIPKYGGTVVKRVRRGDGGDGPFEVQLIDLPSEEAMASYMADPQRQALAEMHARVIARTDVIRVDTVV